MLRLADVRSYLITQGIATDIYLGKIDRTKDQVLGLYGLNGTENNVRVGGNTYETIAFQVLVHWTKSYSTAETKAISIYDLFFDNQTPTIGTSSVIDIRCLNGKPVYLDTDENNIQFI